MIVLNNMETNQDVKYKQLTYGSGISKTFLDETSFPTEDKLSDFEFGLSTGSPSLRLSLSLLWS